MIIGKIYVGMEVSSFSKDVYHLYKPILSWRNEIEVQYTPFNPDKTRDYAEVYNTDYSGFITIKAGTSKYNELLNALTHVHHDKITLAKNYEKFPQVLQAKVSRDYNTDSTVDFITYQGNLHFYNLSCFKEVIQILKQNRLYS